MPPRRRPGLAPRTGDPPRAHPPRPSQKTGRREGSTGPRLTGRQVHSPRSGGASAGADRSERQPAAPGREGGGARVHERAGRAARLGPLVPREGVPHRGRPRRRRDRRGAREALGLHGRPRLARPGRSRGVRRHRPHLRRDGRRRRGARPGRRPRAPAGHRHPVRPDGPRGRARPSSAAVPLAGRLRRHHRDAGPGRPPPGLVARRRHHDAPSAPRAAGSSTGTKLGVLAAEGTTRSPSSPGPATASVPSSSLPPTPAWPRALARRQPAPRPPPRSTTSSSPTTARWASPGSAASTRGIARALEEATVGARARDRRRLRRALPDGPGLREGPQAVRRPRRLLPGHQAQDEQHVPRHRARPLPLLLRRGGHRRGHADRAAAVSMAKAASDDCQRLVVPRLAPVLRRHRLHLGARRPPLHEAGRDRRRALRRSGRSTPSPSPPALGVGLRPEAGQTGAVRPGESLIAALDLAPHPEGGWYRRTWVRRPRTEHGRPAAPSTTSCWRARSRRRTASTPPSCGTSTPATRSSSAASGPTGGATCRSLGPDVAAGQRPRSSSRPASGSRPARSGATPCRGDRDTGLHLRGLRAPRTAAVE